MLRVLFVVLALTTTARAEPWYEGEHGTNRVIHLSIALGGGAAFVLTRGPLEANLAAERCRWCDPTRVDTEVRDALHWSRGTTTARRLSDVASYAVAPTLAFGLVSLGTAFDGPTTAQMIDDLTPVLEAVVISSWLTRLGKLAIARQRPYAHFTGPVSSEDNLSFPSGHTSFAFSLATSAGMVARARGYRSEPWIWGLGLTTATASAYLRIAADRHYLTDVLAGAALGSLAGLTVPLLMRRNAPRLVASSRSIALAGAW